MDTHQATKPKPSKTALFYEAVAAFVKSNKVSNEWPALPTRSTSSISQSNVLLRSGSFFLAKYNCVTKQISKSKV